MKVTNFLPMELMSNTMYELLVGFSCTHPNADKWVETRKGFWVEAMDQELADKLVALTDERIAAEWDGETSRVVDFSAKFKALDEEAVIAGKRPQGWLVSGDTKAQLLSPNLSTLLLRLREGMLLFNVGDDSVDIERMLIELTCSLPDFGDRKLPWRATIDSDFEMHEGYNKEFLPSNVSQHVFMQDNDCDADPYYVNGKFVQFACPMGYVTVWQGDER